MSKDAFEAGILKEERPEGIVGRKNETKKKRKSENWRRTGNRGCFGELARWFAAQIRCEN